VNPEERLAAIVRALESVGLACLIRGGHAVRLQGLPRHTNDFDLTLAPDGWDDLDDRLAHPGLLPATDPVETHRPASLPFVEQESAHLHPCPCPSASETSPHCRAQALLEDATSLYVPGCEHAPPSRAAGRIAGTGLASSPIEFEFPITLF
jgi:hypothetical protein